MKTGQNMAARYAMKRQEGTEMIEEYVINLAELQTELKANEAAADNASKKIDAEIAEAKMVLDHLNTVREHIRHPHEFDIAETNNRIGVMQDRIIDEWSGEEKTIVFGDKVLKFTQRGSLKIRDDEAMLEELCVRMQSYAEVLKYLKGFNLTAVKKYMGVHDLPIDVAEITYKTTVKLEQKE